MPLRKPAPVIRFVAPLERIDRWTIARLPVGVSEQLPSRGQVAVKGTINGRDIETVLEPDGQAGHWMKVDDSLRRATGVKAGDTATLEIRPAEAWPEPAVPPDLQSALQSAPSKIRVMWNDITPMARWEWVRWVNATRNLDTRRRRVEVTISKMNHGKRRPCCFDLSSCTDPDLSRNGKLIEPGALTAR